jgi:hypothetical protein
VDPLPALIGGLFILAWFLFFAGRGLFAAFSGDDLMNLHGYLSRPFHTLLLDNFRYWSTSYRPLGGLFYASIYSLFGFHPFPFRLVCFGLLGVNLLLLFRFCQLLSKSLEVALLATLLVSYHAWFVDLYYSSGTVYDLLCFAFYLGALNFYIRIREQGRRLNLIESLTFCGLYICALNAKEMAVTLPLFVALYEWLFHWGKRVDLLGALLTALITVPYVIGKLTGAGSLIENPLYQLSISPVHFLKTFHLYMNPLFYQDHVFHDSNTVQILLVMLAFAIWRRSRPLLFAWSFLILSMLPVAFIGHYSAFFLYLPSVGWALYAAQALRLLLPSRVGMVTKAAIFLGIACVLAPFHFRESQKTLSNFLLAQPPTRAMTSELLREQPQMKPGARILFVDDPFPKDDYFLLSLTRLLYHDMTIQVTRTSVQPCPVAEYGNYDVVLLYRQGKLLTWRS